MFQYCALYVSENSHHFYVLYSVILLLCPASMRFCGECVALSPDSWLARSLGLGPGAGWTCNLAKACWAEPVWRPIFLPARIVCQIGRYPRKEGSRILLRRRRGDFGGVSVQHGDHFFVMQAALPILILGFFHGLRFSKVLREVTHLTALQRMQQHWRCRAWVCAWQWTAAKK